MIKTVLHTIKTAFSSFLHLLIVCPTAFAEDYDFLMFFHWLTNRIGKVTATILLPYPFVTKLFRIAHD